MVAILILFLSESVMPVLIRSIRRLLMLSGLLLLAGSVCGCSLFVMAGKMFFGDPKVTSAFSSQTGVDLTKGEHELLVICRTPSLMKTQLPTFEHDLTRQVLWRLKQQGVKTVPSDKVARWLDNNGGEVENVSELARDFNVDFIATVTVRETSFREENSEDLFRGQAAGTINVYEVQKADGRRDVLEVFSGEFRTEYPRFAPVARHSMSERTFQKQFIDHLATNIARRFHDYRMGDEF